MDVLRRSYPLLLGGLLALAACQSSAQSEPDEPEDEGEAQDESEELPAEEPPPPEETPPGTEDYDGPPLEGSGFGGTIGTHDGFGIGDTIGTSGSGSLPPRQGTPPNLLTSVEASNGALDEEIIRRVLRNERRALALCFESEFASRAVEGEVRVRVLIDASGTTIDVSLTGDTTDHDVVSTCVVDHLADVTYPEPRGGGIVQADLLVGYTDHDAD